MRLTHLSLWSFRNFARLELALPAGASILAGENAQGKTNLLEAVYLLATTRSTRATQDADLVRWDTAVGGLGGARVVGRAERGRTEVVVEVAVPAREPSAGGNGARLAKRLRVNGVPRRAVDVVGQILAVLFSPEDIDLLTGPPAGRRRYLDVTLGQVDHGYLRALTRYNRVLQQRNVLLRQIAEEGAPTTQLAIWDEELVTQGAAITHARTAAVASLGAAAADCYARLSAGRERLAIDYLSGAVPAEMLAVATTEAELRNAYRAAIERRRARELAAGVTLVGPHRDDLSFTLDGRATGAFGSRAQQRSVALALRLAEARHLREASGEAPVLLLDDVLSELDQARRAAVLGAIAGVEQALITTAEPERFDDGPLALAGRFRVVAGTVTDWPT